MVCSSTQRLREAEEQMRDDTRHQPREKVKACQWCGHGTAIHHHIKGKAPCWFPGCKCKDYKEPKSQRMQRVRFL
jgi:hypothetical protein